MALNKIDLEAIEKYKGELISLVDEARGISDKISQAFEEFGIDSPKITAAKAELSARNADFARKYTNVTNDLANEIAKSKAAITSASEDVTRSISA